MKFLVIDRFADIYKRELGPQFPNVEFHIAASGKDIAVDLAEIDALATFGQHISNDILAAATKLKWVQSFATGVDHFLRCTALRKDTILTSGRGIHGPAMRESAAYLMMTLQHETPRLVRAQAAHRWERTKTWSLLAGKMAVIAGIGIGGTAIGELLKAFGMHVIGVSRTPRDIPCFDEMIHTDRITEAAARADYFVAILPSNPQNNGMIGRAIFDAMKPTAFFVNIGRGETVDEAALIAALRANKIAGAGLDVFQQEPLPPDSPFWDMPNVVVCPHLGGFFKEYEEYVIPLVADNLRALLAGRPGDMKNVIPH